MEQAALDLTVDASVERYRSIQQALFNAVHQVHVPWLSVPDAALQSNRACLEDYRFVYSTNYDLLAYWAVMSESNGSGFLDFFWGDDMTFDPFDTDIWTTRDLWTRLLFLHGGIHLRRRQEARAS